MTFAERYEHATSRERIKLEARTDVNRDLLRRVAQRPNHAARWLKVQIADRLGQPIDQLFPKGER
jgi:hypothetical protein